VRVELHFQSLLGAYLLRYELAAPEQHVAVPLQRQPDAIRQSTRTNRLSADLLLLNLTCTLNVR
jgi:hypothetical protein